MGYSRKEARKMALSMVPRSKKKYLALQTAQNEAPEEIENLQESGVISSDPDTASAQILDTINSNIADGTQARGNSGAQMGGLQGGNKSNTMLYVGIGAVALLGGYFLFFRNK